MRAFGNKVQLWLLCPWCAATAAAVDVMLSKSDFLLVLALLNEAVAFSYCDSHDRSMAQLVMRHRTLLLPCTGLQLNHRVQTQLSQSQLETTAKITVRLRDRQLPSHFCLVNAIGEVESPADTSVFVLVPLCPH